MLDDKQLLEIAEKVRKYYAMRACTREEVIEHWISCWKKASYEKVYESRYRSSMTKKESYRLLLLDCFGIDVTQS